MGVQTHHHQTRVDEGNGDCRQGYGDQGQEDKLMGEAFLDAGIILGADAGGEDNREAGSAAGREQKEDRHEDGGSADARIFFRRTVSSDDRSIGEGVEQLKDVGKDNGDHEAQQNLGDASFGEILGLEEFSDRSQRFHIEKGISVLFY